MTIPKIYKGVARPLLGKQPFSGAHSSAPATGEILLDGVRNAGAGLTVIDGKRWNAVEIEGVERGLRRYAMPIADFRRFVTLINDLAAQDRQSQATTYGAFPLTVALPSSHRLGESAAALTDITPCQSPAPSAGRLSAASEHRVIPAS